MFSKKVISDILAVILFTALIVFVIGACLSALYAETSIRPHKENYFIAGEDDVKFHISLKVNLLYPSATGLYFAYSEKAFWNIYDNSAPFREFNHNPEVFYMLEQNNNIFGNSDLWIIDHIILAPYEHISNGKDGEASRGLDRYYGEIQISIGEIWNSGIRAKVFNFYKTSSKNKDIDQYIGHYEGEFFIRRLCSNDPNISFHKLYIKGGTDDNFKRGWVESGLIVTLLSDIIQPKLFINVFSGYCESLIDYNKKDTQIRAGLLFM